MNNIAVHRVVAGEVKGSWGPAVYDFHKLKNVLKLTKTSTFSEQAVNQLQKEEGQTLDGKT